VDHRPFGNHDPATCSICRRIAREEAMTQVTFQPQNPAISGYSLGWSSCTAFSAAMAASFDQQVAELCTGAQVRTLTHDTTGGLTLPQVDAAVLEGWNVNLNTVLGDTWTDFAKRINAGQGAILQGWYAPIADSPFDAGRGFRSNHAIFVPPGWGAMDPLADGRYGEAYKYQGAVYPSSLLREFAGRLNIGGSAYKALGLGLVYASYTADRVKTWSAHVAKGQGFGLYAVNRDTRTVISPPSPHAAQATGDWSWTCTAPASYRWSGHSSRNLVVLTSGALAARAKAGGFSYAIPSDFAKGV
jgi:hypothetical protein